MKAEEVDLGRGHGPGALTLRVGSPDAVLAFYGELLGLDTAAEGEGWRLSSPGSEEPLLVLEHAPGAPPRPPRAAGLFHLALLVPSREDLGRVFLRLRGAGPSLAGGSLQGASDHGVSRALYLADPEGNGLEIYHDRPRGAWPSEGGRIAMFTRPLDLEDLLEGVDGAATLPAGTSVGHVHLRTADLAASETFWVREAGMETTVRGYPGALFLAHGDYHHHLGLNVWGGPFDAAPGGTLGLAGLEWRTAAGDGGEARRRRTPDGIEVLLRAAR